jgi:DNA-binding NtrC family response regulator
MSMLRRYDFPGNVRELRNIVERWAVLGPALGPEASSLPSEVDGPDSIPASASAPSSRSGAFVGLLELPYHEARDALTERFERAYVEHILDKSGGNVSKAARDAGVDRRHLQRWMARFGLGGRS